MFNQFKRWLIGTLALTLIALAALVTPILSGHAAAPHSTNTNNAIHSQHHGVQPDWFWSF